MIHELRAAVTAAGGTPTQYTGIGLMHELITAWGGTPTQFTMIGLLREAITASGGTPTQFETMALMRELIIARGGEPATFNLDGLFAQLPSVSPVGEEPGEELGPELVTNGTMDGPTGWTFSPIDGGPDPAMDGVLTLTASDDYVVENDPAGTIDAGDYRVTWENAGVGEVGLNIGNASSGSNLVPGIGSAIFTVVLGGQSINFRNEYAPIVLDNLSIRKIL